MLIAQFTSSCLQDRCPRAVVPKLGCSVESPRELVKDADPSSTCSDAYSWYLGPGDSQPDGSQGRMWGNTVLRKNLREVPVHGSPEGDVGRPPSWPFLPGSCFPWQVIARDVKRDFSPQGRFLFYLLLLKLILLHDGNQIKQTGKQRIKSKYFSLPVFIFYLSTMVFI